MMDYAGRQLQEAVFEQHCLSRWQDELNSDAYRLGYDHAAAFIERGYVVAKLDEGADRIAERFSALPIDELKSVDLYALAEYAADTFVAEFGLSHVDEYHELMQYIEMMTWNADLEMSCREFLDYDVAAVDFLEGLKEGLRGESYTELHHRILDAYDNVLLERMTED